MEVLYIKLRMRPGEKAGYHEAMLRLSTGQLHVIKRGGPTNIILLPPDRRVTAATKRGVHYVIMESSTKCMKIKVPSLALQERWVADLSTLATTAIHAKIRRPPNESPKRPNLRKVSE